MEGEVDDFVQWPAHLGDADTQPFREWAVDGLKGVTEAGDNPTESALLLRNWGVGEPLYGGRARGGESGPDSGLSLGVYVESTHLDEPCNLLGGALIALGTEPLLLREVNVVERFIELGG